MRMKEGSLEASPKGNRKLEAIKAPSLQLEVGSLKPRQQKNVKMIRNELILIINLDIQNGSKLKSNLCIPRSLTYG